MREKSTLDDFDIGSEFLSPLQHNLVKFLEGSGPISRRDLCKQFATPRTTIYDNLLKLQRRKIVEKFSKNNGTRGRPVVFWKLKDSYIENEKELKNKIKKNKMEKERWLDESRMY